MGEVAVPVGLATGPLHVTRPWAEVGRRQGERVQAAPEGGDERGRSGQRRTVEGHGPERDVTEQENGPQRDGGRGGHARLRAAGRDG